MRYSILLASVTALATSVAAVPHAREHVHAHLHKRQQMVTQVVTVTARPDAVTPRPEVQNLAADDGGRDPNQFITLPDGDILPKDGPFTPRVTGTGAEVVTLPNGKKSVSHLEQTLGLSTAAQQGPGPTGAAQVPSYDNIPPDVAAYFESDPSGGPPTHDFEVLVNEPDQPGPNHRDYPGTILLQHNFHRKNHSAPEVIWGFALQRTAQDHANKCVFEHDLTAQGGGYGQSLAAGVPADTIGRVITDTFYNPQVSSFDGLYGQASPDTSGIANWGFFTQMVWKNTQQVGCYTVDCSSKGGLKGAPEGASSGFTVCNYWPAGNVDGEYDQNVGQSQNMPSMQWDTDSWPPPGF